MELDIRHYLAKAAQQKDTEALQAAYELLRSSTAAGNVSAELYVVCAEVALQLGCFEISAACLKTYFEGNPPANQSLCRAYLCQGQLKSPPATGTVEDFEEATMYFLKAIEISKQEPSYHSLVFDASVLYFQTVRPLLQPGRSLHLVHSLGQVVQSLEEVEEVDYSWRAELMIHLIKSLIDSKKHQEAESFANVTEEFIKSHIPELYPQLFTLQVQHQLSKSDVLLETSRKNSEFTVMYKLQTFKNSLGEINKNMLTDEDSAELEQILDLLVVRTKVPSGAAMSKDPQCPSPIQPPHRVAFLLELALLALQVKHQKVAADCLKELKSAGEASAGQRIIMECVNCKFNLLKKGAKMNDYSKASVEARLKEVGRLDQWLRTAVREGTPQAVQAVCATQWGLCLPLLQHNLRKRVKQPLLRVASALEDMQSMFLEMRCQVHSELAAIEEEEGCLAASLTHLRKALLLDNGALQERLSSAFRLSQLRQTLYQTPSRNEDKASVLMQQIREMQPEDKAQSRSILVTAGLLLAPDDFQMVLDADGTSKIPVGSAGSEPVAQLAAEAQHHSTCVQKVDGHLARQDADAESTERVNLWATLSKTARKLEVWDVCRAACRFCLLYDDGRWNISKSDKCRCSEGESCAECSGSQSCVNMLRLLAEIHFLSAEATIQKLLAEGVQLNSPAVLPAEGRVSEEDAQWIIYREWIQALSAHATSSFLRAGELGAQIREPWVVGNAAIYLWNYNSHLLAAGDYQRLLPTFQSVVEMLRKTEYAGNRALFVLLCNAVARGLIQPLPGPDSVEAAPAADKGKSRGEKRMEKSASVQGVFLDPGALQDVRKALELCENALRVSTCHNSAETVPLAARKQVLATWVQIKRLLQQQIGPKMDVPKDESETEQVSAMMRVLVGVEMFHCNRDPRHMEFSAPSLSTLVSMASACSWCDAAVELQVWCQLASFCHHVKDHSLVLSCTQNALLLEEAAMKSLGSTAYALYSLPAVNELLSTAACLRGLSLVHESRGDLHAYREALKVLLSSVSFAEKADNPALCVTTARHYWNACLPLTQSPEERWRLQQHLKAILIALRNTTKQRNKPSKVRSLLTLAQQPLGSSKDESTCEEDLSLRAAMYGLLLTIYTDNADFASALLLLDKAIRDMPGCTHQLSLLKNRILVKARQGESIQSDMQKLKDEGEQCNSSMWHQVALCASTIAQQLSCYKKAITSLMSPESQWLKVCILLEFGEWLYCHNFPKADAQHQVQWAIDILLQLEAEEAGAAEDASTRRGPSSVKCESLVGVQNSSFRENVSSLKEVRRLDYLIQAHALLAVMTDKTSPEHQLNLLRAYTFVLRIWQVSISVACEISSEMAKSQTVQPSPSPGSRKGKDKGKGKKVKDPTPVEERPKHVVLDPTLPSTPREWARFVCPDQARQIFQTSDSPHCINADSIPKQTQSLFYLNLLEKELLSLSLDHLTLPVLHLAETIAHDLLDWRSLSDLYRLRILRTCVQLGLETLSPYQEKLMTLSAVQEQEQIGCHKAMAVARKRRDLDGGSNQKTDKKAASHPHGSSVCAQEIWVDKAEVCLSMGLYQSARQLLADSHMVAKELGDQTSISRSVIFLARLACEEQNFAQALILLDKARVLGGDEEFWYQFTLTKVTAVVGQQDQTKVDEIIKQGCAALKLILEQRINRVPELTYLITSLEKRGAAECLNVFGAGEPRETLSTEATWRLMTACATLRECASAFTELNYKEQAAEAHGECAHGLRILASHSTDREEKRRFLLDGLVQLQLAVTAQEHVALNAQSLLPPQEESRGLSLAAVRRLLRLRLALADFSLVMLEEHCAQETQRAVAQQKMTSAERALEDFTRCSPEPNSIEQEWLSVGRTLEQMTLGQLAAVDFQPPDDVEMRAYCLSLTGKYLRLSALQQEPLLACALWDLQKQKGAWPDPKAVSKERENPEEHAEAGKTASGMTSAKSTETQRGKVAQQLMTQASKALAEAVSLCLQHNLSPTILADASLNMLECQGQRDPAVAGQYLALFQSCRTVALMAQVLRSACTDTGASQLTALLSRDLHLSHREKPSSTLKGAENSLAGPTKPFCHLVINPGHLSILAKLPPSLKILLLQHSDDGSQLYGALYETIKASEITKRKTAQASGTLTCSWMAKVPVSPRALLALQEQTGAFGQGSRHGLPRTDSWYNSEGRPEASEEQQKTEKLAPSFREIVEGMEDYLNPLLTQFDFSGLRPAAPSLTSLTSLTKTRDKEERGSSAKLPVETEEYLVILADRMLLELPLESLSILQEGHLNAVSRDFSLQLFYSRMNRDVPQKVESDNKKETKGGKGTKAKRDQSQAIKAIAANHTLPSNTIPVDTRDFKYIVDLHNKGRFGDSSFSIVMKKILETYNQHSTHQWEGFIGTKQKPSLSVVEQLLSRCSAFIYAGLENLLANIPPAKLAAFNLSGCCMALLFDRIQNNARFLHQPVTDMQKSTAQVAVDKPVDTALLLSLAGVGCVVLNQWTSSLQQNTQNMAAVLENVLSGRQTSGQAVHALRKRDSSDEPLDTITGSDDQPLCIGSKEEGVQHALTLSPATLNCVLYGLPNLLFI